MSQADEFDETDVAEQSTVVVDAYDIKLRVTPRHDPRGEPRTPAQVWKRFNENWLYIIERTLGGGLLADSLRGATALLLGLCQLPKAVVERVGRAHELVAEREDERSNTKIGEVAGKDQAIDELVSIIERFKAKGLEVRLGGNSKDGSVYIAVDHSGAIDATEQAALCASCVASQSSKGLLGPTGP